MATQSPCLDLRFCIPNKEVMPKSGIHTLEHLLFAGFMRDHLNGNGVIIDSLPMAAAPAFYRA